MDDTTKRHPIGRAAVIRFLLRSHTRKMKAFAGIAGARNRSVTVAAIRIADRDCRESVESTGIGRTKAAG